ncbi:MAG: hypothetical protein HYY32_05325, partial [Chloroflexi bacterium]|nr:hypothetical protein [Chloroflexota bacterium]
IMDRSLELPVTVISPVANALAHTFEVRIAVGPGATGLKPGMSARVAVPTSRENVVLVPRAAAVLQSGQYAVWVVADGVAHVRQASVGLMDGRNVEIRSGIQANEQVVTSPQGQLREGLGVTVRQPGATPGGTPAGTRRATP